MKNKSVFLTAIVAWLGLVSSFGQQASQSNMSAIAHVLAEQIPEIGKMIVKPDVLEEHCLRGSINDEEIGHTELNMYRYKRPAATTDWVLVAYDVHDFPAGAWLKCFTHDRKTGTLTSAKLPFELLPPSRFDNEEFGEDHDYWRTAYNIFDNGNVLITASPGMSYYCMMLARWDGKENFTMFKRAGYDFMNMEAGKDDAQTEQYVQNVVRPNFQRINAITKWAWIEEKENFELSLEGAALNYYYSDNGLEKIVAKLYGETNECVVEYYFIDGRLSFVYDITTRYGVPKYFDVPANAPPDTKTERRWYLKGNTCFRGIGDKGKKLTTEQIEEEFLGESGSRGAYSLYMTIISL